MANIFHKPTPYTKIISLDGAKSYTNNLSQIRIASDSNDYNEIYVWPSSNFWILNVAEQYQAADCYVIFISYVSPSHISLPLAEYEGDDPC